MKCSYGTLLGYDVVVTACQVSNKQFRILNDVLVRQKTKFFTCFEFILSAEYFREIYSVYVYVLNITSYIFSANVYV